MKGRNKTILPVLVQYKNTPYYASKDGRIFRLRDEGYVEMSQVLIPTGRYKFVKTSVNGNVKNYNVHIIIAHCFIGEKPKGMQVNHIDGNKLNNHADNLEYCTPGENIRHAVRLGLKKGDKGEHNSMAKLTPDEVLEIRRLYGNGNRVRDITKMYRHICRQTVGLIVNRKIWTHI